MAEEASKAGGRVLLVQDTTSFDFTHHPATQGLGRLEYEHLRGFLAHTTLAVNGEGLPLGIVAQKVWVRPVEEAGSRHKRHTTPFAEKESYKWVEGVADKFFVELPEPPRPDSYITVCDREAHIYDFLDHVLARGMGFIVRAAQGRSRVISVPPAGEGEEETLEEETLEEKTLEEKTLEQETLEEETLEEKTLEPAQVEAEARERALELEPLSAAVARQPVQAHVTLLLKRRPERKARTAEMELRYGSLTLARPRRSESRQESLTVQVVELLEVHPPKESEAVHWLLVTSLPVSTPEEAAWVARAYSYRWLIERFHYILKSGYKLEESQLRSVAALERLLAVFTRVAWRLLEMTYCARIRPDVPCTVVLSEDEWQVLYIYRHRTRKMPDKPPTLREAVYWIAAMGGFLARKGDGEPGVKVLWRGWTKLMTVVESFLIFSEVHAKDDCNA
jgi:hypothetical protein